MYVAFPLVCKAQTKQEAAERQVSLLGGQLMTYHTAHSATSRTVLP